MFARIPILKIKTYLGITPGRSMSDVRVRFAPSPTGFMHIGGLRTALINHLFASQQKGTFVLRIEDTDKTRFHPDSVADILRCLEWANLTPSEGPHVGGHFGPYVQSERAHLYTQVVDQLVKSGDAYPCFCTPRRLEIMRNEQFRRKETYRYDNRCRNLSSSEVEARLNRGEPYAIRLKVDNRAQTVNDIVFGQVTFGSDETEGDFIIMKADKMPVYHLANVVDDHFMQISHVIRGTEWLSSTPKHLRLYAALGWRPPQFAHLPLILSSSGGKLSKRSTEFSLIGLVQNLIAAGHLSSAVLTWLTSVGFGGRQSSQELDEVAVKPQAAVAQSTGGTVGGRMPAEDGGEDRRLSGWSPELEYCDLVSRFDVHSISRQNVHLSVDLLRICGRTHFDRLVSKAKGECSEAAATPPHTGGSYHSPVLLSGLRQYTQTYHSTIQLPPCCPEGDGQLIDRLHSLRGRITCLSDLFSADTGVSALWRQPSAREVTDHLHRHCLQVCHLSVDTLQRFLADLVKRLPTEKTSLVGLLKSLSRETGIRQPDVMRLVRVCLTGSQVGLPVVQLVDLLTVEETVKRLQLVQDEFNRRHGTEPEASASDSPP